MMKLPQVAKAIAQEHAESGGFDNLEARVCDALFGLFTTTKLAAIEVINGLALPIDMRDAIVKVLKEMKAPEMEDWSPEVTEPLDEKDNGK